MSSVSDFFLQLAIGVLICIVVALGALALIVLGVCFAILELCHSIAMLWGWLMKHAHDVNHQRANLTTQEMQADILHFIGIKGAVKPEVSRQIKRVSHERMKQMGLA